MRWAHSGARLFGAHVREPGAQSPAARRPVAQRKVLPRLLLGRLPLLLPSVLDVDVDPPIRELLGKLFGPPERTGAVGEDGCPPVLMFDRPLLARVLVGVDDATVGVFIAAPEFRSGR